MLENKIGINDCQAVKKIAEFFELRSNDLQNLRRADNIYRMALKQFDQSIEEAIENCQESQSIQNQQQNLQHYYDRFAERMQLFNQIEHDQFSTGNNTSS